MRPAPTDTDVLQHYSCVVIHSRFVSLGECDIHVYSVVYGL